MTEAQIAESRARLTPGGPVLAATPGPDLYFGGGVYKRAVAGMRAAGEDVDALLARAAANIARHRP